MARAAEQIADVVAEGSRSPRVLALWLANASVLLTLLRARDAAVAETAPVPAGASFALAQGQLLDVVQDALAAFIACARTRLAPAVPSLLKDTLTEPSAAASGWFSAASPSPAMAATDPSEGVPYILQTLDALYCVAVAAHVPAPLIAAAVAGTAAYLGATLFNALMASAGGSQPAPLFQCHRGLALRFHVQQLTDWAAARGLAIAPHFVHVVQAALLLQATKTSLEPLDALARACAQLNSLQIDHVRRLLVARRGAIDSRIPSSVQLLRHYTPLPDEPPVPVVLIDCLRARAMATTDKVGSVLKRKK